MNLAHNARQPTAHQPYSQTQELLCPIHTYVTIMRASIPPKGHIHKAITSYTCVHDDNAHQQPAKEAYLLPIVRRAVLAPFPEDWAVGHDQLGELYYYNK